MTAPKTDRTRARSGRTKIGELLTDPDVRRWHANLSRGSRLTADVYLRRIGKFCEMHGTTPTQLADLAAGDLRAATDLIEDHISIMESEGRAPGYIHGQVKSVKSWLGHFEIRVQRRIRISNPTSAPTIRDERVPDAGEMAELYGRSGLREAAAISLISSSGLRLGVLGGPTGSDGLRIGDLPELEIRDGRAAWGGAPAKVVVRAELSKAGHQYFTFATRGTMDRVAAYLNDRLARGELLDGSSPAIAPDHHRTGRGSNTGKAFLPTARVSRMLRLTFRPRFRWRPYVLRARFATSMLVAESRGLIAHDFHVFFMGHKGGMESRYTTNKGMLPDILMDEMRAAFRRSEALLDGSAVSPAGRQAAPRRDPIPGQTARPAQMVTDAEGAERLIAAGWRFVGTLPNGMVVLEGG